MKNGWEFNRMQGKIDNSNTKEELEFGAILSTALVMIIVSGAFIFFLWVIVQLLKMFV